MIITISGKPGSGKSTIAKLLAQKLNLKHYSTGDFMRKIAKDRGISLIELSEVAESDLSVDQEIDNYSENLGKTEDNFIIDTRLGFHFIPNSIKIFLDAELKVRAQRILKDKRVDEPQNLEELEKEIQKREQSEIQRYQEYYHINHYDKNNYDLIIDSSNSNPEEIVKGILKFIHKNQKGIVS
ncbi:(d)CMP kinase [Nanoarchaeota archaeon]